MMCVSQSISDSFFLSFIQISGSLPPIWFRIECWHALLCCQYQNMGKLKKTKNPQPIGAGVLQKVKWATNKVT